jgi:protein-S-isoprenylcysteine O-methyltransferase Ste14
MPLREEYQTAGEWLFRWRSYCPILLLGVVLLVTFNAFQYPADTHRWHVVWEAFCVATSLLGLMVRVVTVGFVHSATSGRNTKSIRTEGLNTCGMYSVVRHPLYLGNFIMWLGVAMFPRVWWLVLVVCMAFWLYHERIMLAEEEFLRERFGTAFLQWATRTPAFIPRPAAWRPPVLPFSLRTALRREYSGLFAIIATFSSLQFVGDYSLNRRLTFDPLWVEVFTATLGLYLLLLGLKKKGLLDVVGR